VVIPPTVLETRLPKASWVKATVPWGMPATLANLLQPSQVRVTPLLDAAHLLVGTWGVTTWRWRQRAVQMPRCL